MESHISGYLSWCYARHSGGGVAVVRRAGLRIPGLQDLQPCCSGKKTGKVKTEGDKVRKRHNPQYRLDLACVADNISMSCPAWSVLRIALLRPHLQRDYDYLSFILIDSPSYRHFYRLEPSDAAQIFAAVTFVILARQPAPS